MRYNQYVDQHQQLANALDSATKSFEELRKQYDAADPEMRADLEPQLKEATDHVETARADVATLEAQNPKYATAQTPEMVQDREFGEQGPEVAAQVASVSEQGLHFKEALAGLAMAANVQATELPVDYGWEQTPPSQVEQQQEQPIDLGAGMENTVRSPSEQRTAMEEAVTNSRTESQGIDEAYANAHTRSGTDITDQNTLAAEGEQQLAGFKADLRAGICEHGDYATALNDASQSLYTRVTGQEYEGKAEDLANSVAGAMETKYGPQSGEGFEQLYKEQAARLENQQSQEQTQSLSY